jgi:hypothetical protein
MVFHRAFILTREVALRQMSSTSYASYMVYKSPVQLPFTRRGTGKLNGSTKLCGLIKSVGRVQRKQWPDLLGHLVFVYNSTPHRVTGVTPYLLMFGREPEIPLDHLLDNIHHDWDQDYITSQAKLFELASRVARQRIEKAVNEDKLRYDKKARATPLNIGDHVLLQRTGFRDRHKLADNYKPDSYVVVDINPAECLYQVRPTLGGPA